jgi:DNA-binding Lrp family transcriptional regulator
VRDGRAGYAELARAAKTSEGRVARRLATLLELGVVYLDVDLAGVALGYPISAYVWLSVLPSQLQRAGETLATHPEAPFVAAETGRANVVASLMCRDLDELYAYATDRIGAIQGVTAIEISPVALRLKQAGARVDGGRLSGI